MVARWSLGAEVRGGNVGEGLAEGIQGMKGKLARQTGRKSWRRGEQV